MSNYSKFNIKEKKVYRRDIKSKDLGGKNLKLKTYQKIIDFIIESMVKYLLIFRKIILRIK